VLNSDLPITKKNPQTLRDVVKRKSEKEKSGSSHKSTKSEKKLITDFGTLAVMADNIIAKALKKGTLRKTELEVIERATSKKTTNRPVEIKIPTIFQNKRVFWDSAKIDEMREKFKQAKDLILEKTIKDFDNLKALIINSQDQKIL
jgi:hypothetical protein